MAVLVDPPVLLAERRLAAGASLAARAAIGASASTSGASDD
jgi:hypothetical protein